METFWSNEKKKKKKDREMREKKKKKQINTLMIYISISNI